MAPVQKSLSEQTWQIAAAIAEMLKKGLLKENIRTKFTGKPASEQVDFMDLCVRIAG